MAKSGFKYSAADTELTVKLNPPAKILALHTSRTRRMAARVSSTGNQGFLGGVLESMLM